MEAQSIRDDHRDVRMEPTLRESDPHVPFDDTPKLGAGPSGSPGEEPGSAVADRYLLRSRLGWGQLGEIYEAVDLNLSEVRQQDHCVVLERVTLSRNQADLRRRLASEFLSLLSVSHPNVARILDFGVDGTTTFFTTELLEGVSLRSILDSNPTDSSTENELLAIIRGLSDGLGFLHSKGLIHGALKPESVFVTTEYEVKIVDLASARLARARDGSTEMRFGGSIPLDVPDDVFGLACVVYEWLSNEHPFGNVSPFEAFRTETSPRRIKGLPRYRWKALSNAMELQPEARTPTIAEFASEFGITGDETLVEPEPEGAAKRRSFLRTALWIGAIAGLAAVAQANYENLRELFVTLQSELGERSGRVPSRPGEAQTVSPTPVEPLEPAEPASATVYPYPAEPAEAQAPTETPSPLLDGVEQAFAAEGAAESDVQPGVVPAELEPTTAREQNLVSEAPVPGDTPTSSTPLSFRFAEDAVTVFEGEGMVSIVVERTGGVGSEASAIWWTGENTASADDDYADLGVRTEPFSTDQASATVYVPLVSDSLIEPRESFNVFLSWESAPAEVVETLEVFVIDDDS